MKHVNNSMPIAAVVGLCFSILAFLFFVIVPAVMGPGWALLGLIVSFGATALFGGIVAAWIIS